MDALEAAVLEARAAGRRPRLLYTIPTFHNPAGVSLSASRRVQLLELARRHDLVLVEDDVYRELVYDGEAPPALRALDPRRPCAARLVLQVARAGAAPGLDRRPGGLRERLAAAGVLESGGCVSQFSAHVVAAVLEAGAYDAHVGALRLAYASRRDALAAALGEHLPAGCRFTVPAGGFFLWVTLPPGLDASALLPVAERHGVAFAPGRRFCADGDDRSLRLAFSLYDEASLAEGARRLGAAVADASAARR